ncbi:MAG: pre-peptidase C-terminal domain-containing protein [bacterium]|nr:pre-peptidase C-terminal domain-containing protein [bacterium]
MHKLSLAALPVLASGVLAQGILEGVEPNNTTGTATVLPLGDQAYGDITAGDEDWFEITVAADSDFKIWTGPGFAGAIDDTKVRVLESDGTTQLFDVDDGNTATHGYYSTFTGSLNAGTYYVAVRGFDATTAGSYTLDVVLAAPGTYVVTPPVLTPAVEGPENNDPRPAYGSGTATAALVDTVSSGEILAGGGGASYTAVGADYDFYEVSIATAGTLVMETVTGAAAPALSDSILFLADSGLNALASDDDGGASLLSRLAYAVTPGTYYVVVKGWGAGNYELEVSLLVLPMGASTSSAGTNACTGSAGVPVLDVRSEPNFSARPEAPVLGSTYYADATNLPASTVVLRVIGLAKLGSPFDLTSYGAPSCLIEVDPLDQAFSLSDGAGVHFWGIKTPADVAFIGLPIEQQVVALDLPANTLGLSVTNTLSSIFGVTH